MRFFLFTTGRVSADSFLASLLPDPPIASGDAATLTEMADAALAKSKSQLIGPIALVSGTIMRPPSLSCSTRGCGTRVGEHHGLAQRSSAVDSAVIRCTESK